MAAQSGAEARGFPDAEAAREAIVVGALQLLTRGSRVGVGSGGGRGVKPGRPWRFMKAGEIVRTGDEFRNVDGLWIGASLTVGGIVTEHQDRLRMFRCRRGVSTLVNSRSTLAKVRLRREMVL